MEVEDRLRQELEEKYSSMLNFKDSEIDTMTKKLAKISEINIDLSGKVVRLEENNKTLSADY